MEWRQRVLSVVLLAGLLAACGDGSSTGKPMSVEERLASATQPAHAGAFAALRSRDPESPIAVGHVLQIRDENEAAFARFEQKMIDVRRRYGGRVVVATRVAGVLAGPSLAKEVRVVEYERTRDYLAFLESDAFGEAVRLEHEAVETKTLVYGKGAFLPRPTASFTNPDFAGLTRAEAEQMVRDGLSPDSEAKREVIVEMLVDDNPDEFFMVNLLDFRDLAVYPNGAYPGSTAEEANARYSAVSTPQIASRGGGPRHILRIDGVLVGDNPNWELMPTVRYASVDALLDMSFDPDFQAAVVHKFAALAETQILYTRGRIE